MKKMMKKMKRIAMLTGFLLLTSCGGGGGGTAPVVTAPTPKVTSFTITPVIAKQGEKVKPEFTNVKFSDGTSSSSLSFKPGDENDPWNNVLFLDNSEGDVVMKPTVSGCAVSNANVATVATNCELTFTNLLSTPAVLTATIDGVTATTTVTVGCVDAQAITFKWKIQDKDPVTNRIYVPGDHLGLFDLDQPKGCSVQGGGAVFSQSKGSGTITGRSMILKTTELDRARSFDLIEWNALFNDKFPVDEVIGSAVNKNGDKVLVTAKVCRDTSTC